MQVNFKKQEKNKKQEKKNSNKMIHYFKKERESWEKKILVSIVT